VARYLPALLPNASGRTRTIRPRRNTRDSASSRTRQTATSSRSSSRSSQDWTRATRGWRAGHVSTSGRLRITPRRASG